MAIAYVDSASNGFNGASAPRSISHTLGASATRLIAAIQANGGSGFSATWNGVAMTAVGSKNQGSYTTYVFELANPATGSYTVDFSWSGSINGRMICASYSGDDTSLPLTSFSSNSSASSASLTTNHTAITGWTVLIAATYIAASPDITAGSGSTLRLVGTDVSANGQKIGIFDSNANVAGSTSMAFDSTAASLNIGFVLSIPQINAATYTDTTSSLDSNVGEVGSSFSDITTTTDSAASGFGFSEKHSTTWTNQNKS